MEFIRRLWRDETSLSELVRPTSDEYFETLNLMETEETYWKNKLSDEEYEKFQRLIHAYHSNYDLFSEEAFILGIKFATSFFIEIFAQK